MELKFKAGTVASDGTTFFALGKPITIKITAEDADGYIGEIISDFSEDEEQDYPPGEKPTYLKEEDDEPPNSKS